MATHDDNLALGVIKNLSTVLTNIDKDAAINITDMDTRSKVFSFGYLSSEQKARALNAILSHLTVDDRKKCSDMSYDRQIELMSLLTFPTNDIMNITGDDRYCLTRTYDLSDDDRCTIIGNKPLSDDLVTKVLGSKSLTASQKARIITPTTNNAKNATRTCKISKWVSSKYFKHTVAQLEDDCSKANPRSCAFSHRTAELGRLNAIANSV